MLSHDDLSRLREQHPAWRLLRAANAPLIVSFLGRTFVEENVRVLTQSELVSRLDDELYALRERLGDGAYPKSASAYVADWASQESGWLRLYYLEGSDEPHVDATPALERAVAWVGMLQERAFVGTESRLHTLVGLLRQIVTGSDTDPEHRLEHLRAERARLDEQIARAEAGEIDVLDPTGQRDRYQQFASTALELLSDFREVEGKFRALDRQMRETIAGWDGSKGELLDQLLGDRNAISESDQGRSFQAFYDFLLSAERQDELSALLDEVHRLEAIAADDRVRRIDRDWLAAADRTQATVRTLSDQLRRFLDDTVWLENRRVIELLRSIESSAVVLRDEREPVEMELESARPEIALPFERPLYSPPAAPQIDSTVAEAVDAAETTALFHVDHVDHARLVGQVRAALRHRTQVSLGEIVDEHPPEQGLAELMAYFALHEDGIDLVIDDTARQRVGWTDDDTRREADIPTLLYVRPDGKDRS
ncbi:DUF3375 domain-containing protein [Intrasporangium chromatireducens]|uniref:DUF3375 domain-containing protein n=1 Tax=Intrasporangium chromatireducens TaxID=1386088 RepID=UPI0004B1080D|nr:DUF3375 domain-containing protein [Intrasporangium chromatireducens]